jgi:hypothetical protein
MNDFREDIKEIKEMMTEILDILKKNKNKEPKEPKKIFAYDSDEYELAEKLFLDIKKVNKAFEKKYSKYSPKQKENLIQRWAAHIDLLIRVDGQNCEDIRNVISWVAQDTFWSTVILSTANLRKNYTRIEPKALMKTYKKPMKEFTYEELM